MNTAATHRWNGVGYSAARLVLAAWSLGCFAFSVTHSTWSERAVLSNALANVEQRTLVGTLVAAVLAIASLTGLRIVGARARGEDPAAALSAVSRTSLLVAPLGLYGLYAAGSADYVVILVVTAMAGATAAAVHFSARETEHVHAVPAFARCRP